MKLETLELLREKIPRQLLELFPKMINYEFFWNIKKKAEQLQYFSKITFKILEMVKENLEPGITERQLESKIKVFGKKFYVKVIPLLVSFGENTAKIHGYATDNALQENDIIMVDIGIKRYLFSNCTSDITRTFFLGKPTPLQQKIYNIVKKAHDKAIEMLKPGLNPFLVDKMVRDYFWRKNYTLPHGLGHGTGTRYPHHLPILSNKYRNFILKENDIITIEPGIYLSGEFGVRIEDMVLITKDNYEILSVE